MNSVILKYLLYGYLKNLFKVTLFFYCFGIILNLFEEIEFFKNLDVTIFTPFNAYKSSYTWHVNSIISVYNFYNQYEIYS